MVATDLAESYRAGISPHLDHAIRVADPFHVSESASDAWPRSVAGSKTRRWATEAGRTTRCFGSASCCWPGSNGSTSAGRTGCSWALRLGDPADELLGAWLAKESVRDVYLTEDLTDATVLLDKAIVGCKGDEVDEV